MISSSDILHGKILIVDDKEINILLLERILRGAGYVSITSTMDPYEVCALHREHRFDLILLDVQMPGMNGFQVLEGLKVIEPDGYLPVLVITAQPSHKLSAFQAGARDFIGKPFDQPEVLARVHNMLEVRLLYKELHNYNDELIQTHEELSSLNEHLEDKVKERTAALSAEIAERKRAEEALRESNVFNTMLLQTIPLGMDIVDEAGQILFLSPAMAKVFTKNALSARCWDMYKDDKQQCIDCPLKKKIEVGVTNTIETTGVLGGRVFEISHTGIIFQGQQAILEVFHDITARKQAEKELKTYSERLEEMVEERTRELRLAQEQLVHQERLAVLGQLAGSVSHELRNPLAVISNAAYFLRLFQPDANEKVKEYLNIIEAETLIGEKIITDMLDFVRNKTVEREPIAVSELLCQTLERYHVPPSVNVVTKIAKNLPLIYADPHLIVQALGNLAINAYQAMPDGGKLTLSASAEGAMIVIAVQDTGEGIPPENMERLFEPLFTTKINGIGLGLPVSRKLVEANGGHIEVQSEPGKGSTFRVYLPVTQ